MYLFRTVLLPLSVYICCSLYLCLSFCLSLSFSLCPSVGCFACLSLSFSVCLSVTLCLPVCLSISVSLSFVTNLPSLILFLARFLSLSQSYHCLSNICKMNLWYGAALFVTLIIVFVILLLLSMNHFPFIILVIFYLKHFLKCFICHSTASESKLCVFWKSVKCH